MFWCSDRKLALENVLVMCIHNLLTWITLPKVPKVYKSLLLLFTTDTMTVSCRSSSPAQTQRWPYMSSSHFTTPVKQTRTLCSHEQVASIFLHCLPLNLVQDISSQAKQGFKTLFTQLLFNLLYVRKTDVYHKIPACKHMCISDLER